MLSARTRKAAAPRWRPLLCLCGALALPADASLAANQGSNHYVVAIAGDGYCVNFWTGKHHEDAREEIARNLLNPLFRGEFPERLPQYIPGRDHITLLRFGLSPSQNSQSFAEEEGYGYVHVEFSTTQAVDQGAFEKTLLTRPSKPYRFGLVSQAKGLAALSVLSRKDGSGSNGLNSWNPDTGKVFVALVHCGWRNGSRLRDWTGRKQAEQDEQNLLAEALGSRWLKLKGSLDHLKQDYFLADSSGSRRPDWDAREFAEVKSSVALAAVYVEIDELLRSGAQASPGATPSTMPTPPDECACCARPPAAEPTIFGDWPRLAPCLGCLWEHGWLHLGCWDELRQRTISLFLAACVALAAALLLSIIFGDAEIRIAFDSEHETTRQPLRLNGGTQRWELRSQPKKGHPVLRLMAFPPGGFLRRWPVRRLGLCPIIRPSPGGPQFARIVCPWRFWRRELHLRLDGPGRFGAEPVSSGSADRAVFFVFYRDSNATQATITVTITRGGVETAIQAVIPEEVLHGKKEY